MHALIGVDLLKKLPRRNVDFRDTKLPGFILRCRASGVHSYRVELGRGQFETLGRVGVLEPHEARTAAQSKLAQRHLHRQGLAEDPRTKTHAAATFDEYLETTYQPWALEHHDHGQATIDRLRATFADFLALPLPEISSFAVDKWRIARLKAGASAATVNRDLNTLRGALSRAVEWKLLKAHPLATVKASKVDPFGSVVRYLSAAEETRLVDALTARDDRRRADRERANVWRRERNYPEWPAFGTYTDHIAPIVLVAMHTGLRFGELTALRWADVDRVNALLTVRSEVVGAKKSGRVRYVPLHKGVAKVLRAWEPKPYVADAYVFPGADGERIVEVKTAWSNLLSDARITNFRFHDLRHHFASRLVQSGVDLNTVRELLGHTDIKMTLRYAHLAPEQKAAAVAKLMRA